ncbi:hypothetical protein BDV95DRAFT_490975 [Massariosphaeria phaeospora]|uniref:Cyclin-domain-containing protein n=1 Tax=Massariosphaeria phaeospora TaxID=100035 RepID=A0A7C8M7R5_9PLEO|nr:hypothetical protein BDV95DRAFT_490975 [Massariosphaeria phaeospora]
MNLDTYPQSLGTSSPRSHPYTSSASSSASSSTSSVFSDIGSQVSSSSSSASQSIPSAWDSGEWSRAHQATPITTIDPESLSSFAPITRVSTFPLYQPSACRDTAERVLPPLRTDILPLDQRQHPRRSSTLKQRAPPQLVRQCDRKVNFVDCLVDSATKMVEVIWPLSVPSSRCETANGRGVLPLRTFIQETLRRSRTSYSTLQVALYYLILIKAHVPKHDFTMEQPEDVASLRALQCGRRMFLAALVLASKYLQDRNYSARAWSKISGLKVCEINTNEIAFLIAINWKLHITDPVWERWQEVVLRHTPSNPPSSPGVCIPNTWRTIIPHLTPGLEMIEVTPKTPSTPIRPELKPQATQYSLRSPLRRSDAFGSQESTPTPSHYRVPRFLEPQLELLPPTPSLPRLGPLPTPYMTPQPAISNTPAASALALGSRRPSMCSAMAQAQSSSLARTCFDQYNPGIRTGLEAYHFPSRRPSLAPSTTSTASSPESMMTDNSRSSRASSISSVSSAGWAPNQAKLAKLATCRNARLPYPALSKCKEQSEYAPSEPMSSPDLESFHIYDSDATPVQVESPVSISVTQASHASRKRGRSSVDLQQNVRHLLHSSRSSSFLRGGQAVVPDRSVAQSFLYSPDRTPSSHTVLKGLQSPKRTVSEQRLPVQKEFGNKRTCCGSQVAQTFRREGSMMGPGMWAGIL